MAKTDEFHIIWGEDEWILKRRGCDLTMPFASRDDALFAGRLAVSVSGRLVVHKKNGRVHFSENPNAA